MPNWCFKCLIFCLPLRVVPLMATPQIEGWHWYKDPSGEQQHHTNQQSQQATMSEHSSPNPHKQTRTTQMWSAQIKAMQKQHDEALAQAILNPSPDTVEQVLWIQKDMMDKAVRFQELWQQVVLQKGEAFLAPELNANLLDRKIREQEDKQKLAKELKALSHQYGLFFALKQDCPYCEWFIPIVTKFAGTYGFEVLGIGDVSSASLPFKVLKDNGVIKLINPEQKFPALFLVNVKHKEVWPLAWGLNALSDLERNAQVILKQMAHNKGTLS